MKGSFLVLLLDLSSAVVPLDSPGVVGSCCGAGGGGGGIIGESGLAFGTRFGCVGGSIVGACLQIESLG